MNASHLPARHQPRPWLRVLFAIAGALSLLAGVIGIFLPVLPTTPFVLLAAACFARSSPRVYGWLLSHRLFGPIIVSWQRERAVPRRVKWIALSSMALSISVSILLMQGQPWLQLLLAVIGLSLGAWLARLPEPRLATVPTH